MRRFLPHLLAALFLALFVMALFARLLFTDRVLATGDILLYFYPYRDYAAAALREGQIPLWNPYIFSGVPFLANPQAAVLYPLHWPLSWLPVTKQIYVSAALHAWILGLGGYVLLRRWHFGWTSALVAGIVLAGSGFYGGLIGHLNQMNAAAWLPWMASLFAIDDLRLTIAARHTRQDNRQSSVQAANPALTSQQDNRQSSIVNRQSLLCVAAFSLLVALTLLAGHTQTAYINLFGVGVWIVIGAFTIDDSRLTIVRWRARMRRTKSTGQAPNETFTSQHEIVNRQSSIVNLLSNLLIYALGVVLGVLLSAAQLLPTLELSDLGLRSGGLTYWDATSFSLQPLNLLWTLLPSYGLVDLSMVFGVAFTEFVGYVGTIPLLLALVGLWRSRGQRAWWFGVTFVVLGLFLALGRWNPLYYVLFQLVPGFDLFRTPARWLMLYTLGMAVLAALTICDLRLTIVRWSARTRRTKSTGQAPNEKLTPQHEIVNRQSSIVNLISLILLTLISLDLILSARSLPHTHPTAPQAVYDVRTAPAHLLTAPERTLDPAAMGRFLSLSITTFDPGDMADWRRIYREGESPQLDEKAFMDLIVAIKIQELLGHNLPLLWRVPAVDGFDGGVLPLQRYNQFMSLLIPAERLVPDGRIREQLADVPPADMLSLLNAQYVITDKIRDLWFEGVYFDRQIGATLATSLPAVDVDAPGTFSATMVGVIGFVDGQPPAENQQIASVQVFAGGEMIEEVPLLAGEHFADPVLDSVAAADALVAFRDVENNRQEYLARLALTQPTSVDNLRFVLSGDAAVTIQAVTLLDERTNTFLPLLPSDQGHFRLVHSGDVKIYEALDVRSRAYMADRVDVVSSTENAITRLQTDRQLGIAVVEASADLNLQAGGGDAAIIAYAPERVVVRTRTEDDSFLVLSDAYYPGWQATIDGAPTPIYPTNVLFRGVAVPAGEHEIVFSYEPQTWRTGVLISGVSIVLWSGLLVAALFARRHHRNTEQEN
ncbi:YfhO family protein [bacterium]|nr:YfhO family protein [bacterium]